MVEQTSIKGAEAQAICEAGAQASVRRPASRPGGHEVGHRLDTERTLYRPEVFAPRIRRSSSPAPAGRFSGLWWLIPLAGLAGTIAAATVLEYRPCAGGRLEVAADGRHARLVIEGCDVRPMVEAPGPVLRFEASDGEETGLVVEQPEAKCAGRAIFDGKILGRRRPGIEEGRVRGGRRPAWRVNGLKPGAGERIGG